MKGLFSYPDVVVICGEPQYHHEHRDVVINPAVIIEVLSESTEARSRGKVSSLPDLEPGADLDLRAAVTVKSPDALRD